MTLEEFKKKYFHGIHMFIDETRISIKKGKFYFPSNSFFIANTENIVQGGDFKIEADLNGIDNEERMEIEEEIHCRLLNLTDDNDEYEIIFPPNFQPHIHKTGIKRIREIR